MAAAPVPARNAGRLTTDRLRATNVEQAARLIHRLGPMTRTEMAGHLGVTRATALALANDLEAIGLVVQRKGAGGVGRPPVILEPSPNAPAVIAIAITVSHVEARTITFGNRVIRGSYEHLLPSADPGEAIERVCRMTANQMSRAGNRIVAIGISFAGVVSLPHMNVRHAPNLRWRDVSLTDRLEKELAYPVPIVVGNDANLAVLADFAGGGNEPGRTLLITGDVGIGTGVIEDGRLLLGQHGSAGEAGHMVVNPGGARCGCGRIGCWETEIGQQAFLRAAGESAERGAEVDLRRIVARLASAPPSDALIDYAGWVTLGLANLINILDPARVVFDGMLAEIWPLIEPIVRERLIGQTIATDPGGIEFGISRAGSDGPIVGAAQLAFATGLFDPLATGEYRPPRF